MVATQERPPARALDVTPGANGIGAEVAGVDIASGLTDAQVAEIEQALVDHKVLFFRDQDITSQQQLAFGRRFGPLEIHPFASFKTFASPPEEPELIIVEAFPEKPMVAEDWHSDVSWRETPALASILRVTDVPEAGGDTMWADMEAAYDGLDDSTRRHLSSLTAVHDWHKFRDVLHMTGSTPEQIAELVERFPPMEHPVVRTHPVSGRKSIYVNGNFTVRIKGMSDSESDALLQRLYRLADNPDYHARMHWQPGSIAFWDNRSTQHSVIGGVRGYRRLERVTIAGDRPF
jgi:taurine dioxygenase